jgi:uncharacterized iron-regulated membrane protein
MADRVVGPHLMADSFFRLVWRWHFWAGLLACPVLLVVAVTGGLYTFREEIEDAWNASVRFVEPTGARKPTSEQLARVERAHPGSKPTRVIIPPDPDRSTAVVIESAPERAVYVNPYTGDILGDSPTRSLFFGALLTLHRSLFAGSCGRVVVELTTSWTLVLLVTGAYLWLPARWNRLRGVWLPRLRVQPYTVLRDFHAVCGVYLLPVIGAVAFTGLVFSVVWPWSFNRATNGSANFPQMLRPILVVSHTQPDSSAFALDAAVGHARERFPTETLIVQLPQNATEGFQVTARGSDQAIAGWIGADRHTGEIVAGARADELLFAERARVAMFPIHIGSIGGWPTKVLAALACAALVWLGLSGVWMWLKRRPVGCSGFPTRPQDARVPKPAVVLILILAVVLPTVGLSLLVVLTGEWLVTRYRPPPSLPLTVETPEPTRVGANADEAQR